MACGASMPVGSNTKGAVDVIIAAWNCEDTIGRAVETALGSPAARDVFVVDDASTDETAARANAAGRGNQRLSVIKFGVNYGPSAARNVALDRGSAPWIAILDGDDYLLPGRFEKLLSHSSGMDVVADDLLQIDEARIGCEEPKPMLSDQPFSPWRCDLETFVLGNISRRGRNRRELGFFKPIMRRAFLHDRNLRYSETLRFGEDYNLYARALALGARFLVVPAQGYVSVMRANSLSANHSKKDLEQLRDSDVQLAAFPNLSRIERLAILRHRDSIDARIKWLEAIEAFKKRQPARFFGTFFHTRQAAAYVGTRLAEQALLRLSARLRRSAAPG
jgi:succinoglycan biosynthesis protein ExoU